VAKILLLNETSQKVSPTVSHNMQLSPKSGKRQSNAEDTEELLPKSTNITKSSNSNNSNNNNYNSKKSKSSPLRRMGFPLSRAMTLPTQTL